MGDWLLLDWEYSQFSGARFFSYAFLYEIS